VRAHVLRVLSEQSRSRDDNESADTNAPVDPPSARSRGRKRHYEPPACLRRVPSDFMPDCLSDSSSDGEMAGGDEAQPCARPDFLSADKGVGNHDIDAFEVHKACVSSLPRTSRDRVVPGNV